MEDWYSEDREFEPVSGTFPFVDKKISNQNHAVCCSRVILATGVGLCSCVCLADENGNLKYFSITDP